VASAELKSADPKVTAVTFTTTVITHNKTKRNGPSTEVVISGGGSREDIGWALSFVAASLDQMPDAQRFNGLISVPTGEWDAATQTAITTSEQVRFVHLQSEEQAKGYFGRSKCEKELKRGAASIPKQREEDDIANIAVTLAFGEVPDGDGNDSDSSVDSLDEIINS
jgi:hypothetical protein